MRQYAFCKINSLSDTIVVIFLIMMAMVQCQSANAIGLKIIRSYPNTMLSVAKAWSVATYGDRWTFFATQDGVIQYDGSAIDLFRLNNRYAARSVRMDEESYRLYVGGINEFGYFLPSSSESLKYVCLSDSVGNDRYIGNIWGIYPSKNEVYAQGDMNIIVYDQDKNQHYRIDCSFKLDCSNMIDDVLWLGSGDGLKFLMGRTVVDAPGADLLKGCRIRGILPYGKSMLIVTADRGVFRYDRNELTYLKVVSESAAAVGEIFSADIFGGTLALGSIGNGVVTVDMSTGSKSVYSESSGLPNNTVLSLGFDSSGNLWTGLDVGVAEIMLTTPVETFSNNNLPIGSGSAVAIHKGKMYLGTNRGLFYFDYTPGEDISGVTFRQIPGVTGQVWGLTEIDGDLFCCHDRGLFIVKDGLAKRIEGTNGTWDLKLLRGAHRHAYVGTYFGFQIIEKRGDTWILIGAIDGYKGSCYNFVQESPTKLWSYDGESGIYRLDIDTATMRVKDTYNYRATADGQSLTSDVSVSRIDNDIYFAAPSGIWRYDSKANSIVRDERLGLLIGSPKNVRRLKKRDGKLYALTDKEIICADPAGILGVRRLLLLGSDTRPIHDGDLFFPVSSDYLAYPTHTGFLFFDFSDPSADENHPDTVLPIAPLSRIGRVAVTAMKDSTIFRGNFISEKGTIVLRYSENSIKIEFGNPLESAQGVVYSCRLNHEKWSSPSSSNVKEYTNLKNGDFRFDIKAISPDGLESVDSIEFRVLPPWWRSGWAMSVYVILAIAMVYGCIMLERMRVHRKQQALIREKDAQLIRQQADFEWESKLKDHKIIELEKEKLDKELRHKAQEMANVMMSLSHKNETLQTVKRDLQNIQQMLPKSQGDARRAIQELQGKVTVDIKSDQVFNRVVEEFDLVHDDFIKKLRQRFLDLSNNEVLMCAYLKMNLSTKEIAPLLNISVRGVETMRYRIRKKFGLERDDSLTDFINKF